MTTFQISPPEKFNFYQPEDWPKWFRRFERFRLASDLTTASEEKQISTLVYAMGDDAEDILASFNLSAENRTKYDVVVDRFNKHFIVKRNVIYERAKFNSRRQGETESIDSFITSLFTLAEHCQYGALRDEMIRDRIVVGLNDTSLSEKLQLDSELTLERAMNEARLKASVHKQHSQIQNNFSENYTVKNVDALHSKKYGAIPKRRASQPNQSSNMHRPNYSSSQKTNKPGTSRKQKCCSRCGKSRHQKSDCPAKDVLCLRCNRIGHYASMCYSTKVNVVDSFAAKHSDNSDSGEDYSFLGSVHSSTKPCKPWTVTLTLNEIDVEFKIDTGADVTVVPDQVYRNLKTKPVLQQSDKKLCGPGQLDLQVVGKFTTTLRKGENETEETIYVVKDLQQPLLGRPAIEKLGVLARIHEIKCKQKYKEMFPSVFSGLGEMSGEYTIRLKPNAIPHAITTPRRIPMPLLPAVKEELQRMEKLGIISKVDTPTEWCAGLVVVPKANGKVRLCVDLTKLNDNVQREVHPLPTVDETLAQLSGAKVFSKLDANSGFWQLPLSPESAPLTTFLSPFGRFSFNRVPFGISSAPEVYHKHMCAILEGLPGVLSLMDDVIISGRTQEEHDTRILATLERLRDAGVTLNDKCEFSKTELSFLGHIIDGNGIRPDPRKVESVLEMPPPQNVSSLRSFLGMTNQLGKFSPNLAEKTKPIRELLNKQTAWYWGDQQQRSFEAVKQELCKAPALSLYDVNKQTRVSADASSYGLGAVISQKQSNDEYRPVAFASTALTETECRYAQIEKEALGITWACERFSQYIVGKQFEIETDHKPLIPLLNSKNLDSLPPRIQRFRIRLMRFQFKAFHVPGKQLTTPDTLSRAPLSKVIPSEQDRTLENETAAFVDAIFSGFPATEARITEIQTEQENDPVCSLVAKFCRDGWPTKHKIPSNIKPYWQVSGELTVQKGLLLKGTRIVIPSKLQHEILSKLHNGHQGIVKCRGRAQQSVWWPGLSSQIETVIKSCETCCKEQLNSAEPMIITDLPDRPWQKVATDIFELHSKSYILVIDYFSRFIEIAKLNSLSAKSVIEHLKSMFARHGIPLEVRSDNVPYNSEEFHAFAKSYGFKITTSSPRYSQSNGEAERAVQTIKSMLRKATDPYLALLAYRSTPLQNGYTPSELLMGRKLRTTVPVLPSQLNPKIPNQSVLRKQEAKLKSSIAENYNKRHRVKPLPSLSIGDKVWFQDPLQKGKTGTVTGICPTPRSYSIATDSGEMRRNRKHLTPFPNSQCNTDSAAPPISDEPPPCNTRHSPIVNVNTPVRVTRSGRRTQPPKRLDL